ncbi:proclotting enzyme-like isoform X7 [Maniola hyperantus]|uniref:proclotting enzyme-like isoform X7 n=1 Tax=Aphantopus hyperantus TaxID=2795564 RepID=UPI003748C1C8
MARVLVLLCVCLCYQLVYCQFGFFPREQRRYQSPFGFGQNFIPNTANRFRNALGNILHGQPQTPADNPEYNYPIQNQNRPGNQYNQYYNNRPNNVRFPNQGYQNPDGYYNNGQNNQEYAQRPAENQYQQTGYGFENGGNNNEQFLPNNEGNDPYYDNGFDAGQQNGPAFGQDNAEAPNFGNEGNAPDSGLVSGQQNGPAFGQGNAPDFGNEANGQIVSGQQNGPAFGQNNGNNGGLISGKENGPAFGQNEYTNAPTFASENDVPRTPVPDTDNRNNFGNEGIFKETCPTVDNGIGTCINIKQCPPYVKLLQQAQSNSGALQVLRKAHCGFDGNTPKVCCPRQTIPEVTPAPTPAPTQAPTKAPTDTAAGKSLTDDFISAFPVPPECGFSNATFSRVVGGIDAKLGAFPWMTLLGYKGTRSPTTSWLCGGSLVSHHHVLTAAHCIHNHEDDLYVVRVGELDLAREDEGATPMDVLIKNKIKHEEYNPKAFTNDIALLVLQNDVQFTDLIKPICIPMESNLRSMNFEDYNPFIAGWGDLEFRGPKATRLQVLQLPVVSNDFCKQAYNAYKAQVIDDRVLCAGFKKGGKDSCQGDSGGPLMQPIYNSETLKFYFYQIGVVSFGKKCAEAGFPGVYTRVTNFVPWLQQNMLGP